MMILSRASSRSSSSTWLAPRLAAMSAAALIMASICAPEKPGVARASMSESTSRVTTTLVRYKSMISRRPLMSGSGTSTLLSKRPGRVSAGSRISAAFVAAMTMTFSFFVKPSMHDSSWFSV